MIKTLAFHVYATVASATRDLAVLKRRSPQWPAVERGFLKDHRACAVCGVEERLQVHHKKPFHLHPELELDPENLVTLCMSLARECHIRIGHGGDFKAFNPKVVEMVESSKGKAFGFDKLVVEAEKIRRYAP